MVIGGAGALFAWHLRRSLTESPRWLESRGRDDEAAALVDAIEHEIEREHGSALTPPPVVAVRTDLRMPWLDLWKPPFRRRTLMMIGFHVLQTVGVYGWANWLPTFLVQQGVALSGLDRDVHLTPVQVAFDVVLGDPIADQLQAFEGDVPHPLCILGPELIDQLALAARIAADGLTATAAGGAPTDALAFE